MTTNMISAAQFGCRVHSTRQSTASRFSLSPTMRLPSKTRTSALIGEGLSIRASGSSIGGSMGAIRVAARKPIASPNRQRLEVRVQAADGEAAVAKSSGTRLAFYFFLWYAFNIIFNIFNKSTLNIFPYPWFISTLQLAAGVLYVSMLWLLRLQPLPKVPKSFYIALIPVAFFHTVGHVSACVSFSKMSVSFTHIIKAAEPVLSVLLSWPLMGETYSLPVYLSLLPIVAGCSLSAMKEVSMNMAGLSGAMISNMGMVLRNIYSKKSLNNYVIDGINLYALISIVAVIGLAPVAYAIEGAQWSAGYAAAVAKVGEAKFLQMLAAGGLFYHLYNQVSYQALEGINPTTFSVGNTMKRVVVVISSVMFFKNPVSPLNWVGSALAIFGTFWYSQAKDAHSKALKEKAAAAQE
eukprot:CAMPEP_0114245876 /NCGR_PEP_ID=MMETSP0058-20121206/12147_1 /TAXON_ID=36894 /ORGANISM="Pyramimonas parkeae, CCMP726" /LENGTH=407 /DNA_ID=CAMNT_0001358993 /DNA_START=242 /DNA_END=1465 /DNA_ORIENTATION=+